MSLSNLCYKRTDIDCNPVDQPAKIEREDAFSNKWYDFNGDYEKKGLQISPDDCEDLDTDDYERNDIDCNEITLVAPVNPKDRVVGLRYEFLPDAQHWERTDVDNDNTHTSNDVYVRGYIRRDTDNNPYNMEVCPREIIIENPFVPDQVSISEYEFVTENNLLISSEQEPSFFFEPEVNTYGDDLQFTP